MALITWNDNFSVNIAEIDKQHQKLITIVKANHNNDAIGQVLAALLDYTKKNIF